MKKLLVMLLAMALVLAFAACGAAPAEDAAEPEETAEETTEETTEEPAPEEQTEPEPAAGEVSIDGNVITVSDDGTGEDVDKEGMVKKPVLTAHDIEYMTESGPIQITVHSVQLANLTATTDDVASLLGIEKDVPGAVFSIKLTVENTSTDDVGIYPDQSVIVTDTKEQVNSNIILNDQVGGDFLGQVIKDGQIYFICKNPADDIHHIQWRIDAAHDSSYYSLGEDIIIEFELNH